MTEGAASNQQKVKLLVLWDILRTETDEDNPLTNTELVKKLAKRGIGCAERVIPRDIKTLNDTGFSVSVKRVNHVNQYYASGRPFDLSELAFLIDAVRSARCIPEEQTEKLVARLAALTDRHQAKYLLAQPVRVNIVKHTNEEMLANIAELKDALMGGTKASFLYFDRNAERERVYRKDGERYTVDPLLMLIDDNDYYLICYDGEAEGKSRVFRVDRMSEVRAETELIGEEAADYSSISRNYMKQTFQMFNGSLEEVTLEFTNSNPILNHVFDRFGQDVKIEAVNPETCRITVEVQISRTFWAWLTNYAGSGDMRLIAPESAKTAYRDWLKKALEGCGEA